MPLKALLSFLLLIVATNTGRADTNSFSADWLFWDLGTKVSTPTVYTTNVISEGRIYHTLFARRGSGLGANTSGPDYAWAFTIPQADTMEGALLSGSYIEFNMGPTSPLYEARLSEVIILASSGGAPVEVGLFSSVTGYSIENQIGPTQTITAKDSDSPDTLTFNFTEDYSLRTNYYRLYFASSETGSFALGASQGFTSENAGLQIQGEVRTVPEPNMYGYLAALAIIWIAAIFFGQRRSQRRPR